jgi:two-component system cell cycle response regulator
MPEQKKRSQDFWEGYRDGSNAVWDEVAKMTAKGYTSREMQITANSKRYTMTVEIERELGIQPKAPPPEKGGAKSQPDALLPGSSILFRELKPEKGFALFSGLVRDGKQGYCVARTAPQLIRDKYNLQNAGILWLSSADSDTQGFSPAALGIAPNGTPVQEETINPTQLPLLFARIANFMEGSKGGAVFVEGLEYLITNNSFPSVLKFVEKVIDTATKSGTILVLSANPATMDPKEFSQLEREMSQVM